MGGYIAETGDPQLPPAQQGCCPCQVAVKPVGPSGGQGTGSKELKKAPRQHAPPSAVTPELM